MYCSESAFLLPSFDRVHYLCMQLCVFEYVCGLYSNTLIDSLRLQLAYQKFKNGFIYRKKKTKKNDQF